MKIALLINTNHRDTEDNCWRFSRQLGILGHQVFLCPIDSLALDNGLVVIDAFQATERETADLTDLDAIPLSLIDCSLVWILGLGQRAGFLDKVQLLKLIESATTIINPLDCILHLKSKYLLNSLPDIFPQPETYGSANWRWLLSIMRKHGGTWIIKPPAGSYGRDVYKVHTDDVNASVILQNMTAHNGGDYCLLQRHIAEIEGGEKRVLFAAGQLIGQYLRNNPNEHRNNLAQGAAAEVCELTREETVLCQKVGVYLEQQGTGFVAMDMAFPYVVELNVINPGGLGTLEQLTGHDYSPEVVSCILARLVDSNGANEVPLEKSGDRAADPGIR